MPETNRTVRLAILGAGHMGTRHAACAAQIPEARVVAVWSRTFAHAAALAEQIGARAYASLEQAVQSPDVDAVIVCTPNAYHAQTAVAAAQAGKHVICEKPLARTLNQAETIIQAAEKAGVQLLVAHVVRFSPAFQRLHELVRKGRVGQPAVIRMSRETDAAPSGWRADLALSGGTLLELGVHDFDWLLWTCGPVERVYCSASCRGDYSAHDYALTTLRLRSGAIAHIESSMVKASGFRTHGEIAGDAGLLTYDSDQDTALQIHTISNETPEIRIPTTFTTASPYVVQLQHFCRCILGLEPPRITPQEAFEALRVALAALDAAQNRRPVLLA